MQVIGAGFGRTGTLSLKLALEQIGFGPCYHMMEVFRTPGHAEVWQKIALGEKPDWNSLFSGYRATVDWPSTYFWRELVAAHPKAKVVLTERDPASWYKSMSQTILAAMQRGVDTGQENPVARAQQEMAQVIVNEKTFGRRFDEAHVLDVYRRHNETVKREIPAERLLVYDGPQGWEPLCRFLGVAVPKEPFPKTNSTEEFRVRANL
ncbi:MAG: sulfotransferase family protein [Proteobacteria bacterium]|nr:sulfotransferase family protein [Pseudomonadota bacterium]